MKESALYDDIEVDILFTGDRPEFGDLFTICGYENPNFPPSNKFDFSCLNELQFSQIDDYFGLQAGGDVSVWLYPIVNGEVVDHHPGPFDGIRLAYNVLRNPLQRSADFLSAIEILSTHFPVTINYKSGSDGLRQLGEYIGDIAEHWEKQGIQVGSDEALEL